MSEILCPDDSYIREITNISSLIHTSATSSGSIKLSSNGTGILDEFYTQCCVAPKCICKVCEIPTCSNNLEVLYEIVEERQTPGKCCGEYECRMEPNCSEVRDTEGYWLSDCQRCKCVYGKRICHRSCDEVVKNPPTAFCKSKALNRFFSNGETWKEECSECDCRNGEPKCVIALCRSINCPKSDQVTLKGSCCPVCWTEKNQGHRNGVDDEGPSSADYEDENIGGGEDDDDDDDYDEDEDENEEMLRYPLSGVDLASNSTEKTYVQLNSTLKTINITEAPETTYSDTTIPTLPCQLSTQDPSATYAVYPEIVEFVQPAYNIDVLYTIIGCLSVTVIALCAIVCQMRAKQRSYRPVSNFDDNFNKLSSNIKKMNDYV